MWDTPVRLSLARLMAFIFQNSARKLGAELNAHPFIVVKEPVPFPF